MIRLSNVRVDITNNQDLLDVIASKLKVKKVEIKGYKIHKRSIDARSKMLFAYVYEFDIDVINEGRFLSNQRFKNVTKVEQEEYDLPERGSDVLEKSPIVVGMGPAGLFASYFLAKMGYKPIIFERGESVEDRIKSIDDFWKNGVLKENSNVQFGEGGAGTFSDGKLNTLVKDKSGRMRKIFEIFVECGAPEEILYESKPHIGTDILRKVIVNMRNKIIEFGAVIHYNSLMEDIIIKDNKVKGIVVNGEFYETDVLVLAIGHSARDTFQKLNQLGLKMEAKPLAVGVRIIHPQRLIDENQYPINYPNLPASSYKLTYKSKSARGVYSFCMCPGGYVVNASSLKNRLVVNGMSNYKRDSGFANSAIIVTVGPDDFGNNPLDGMRFLKKIEKKAFDLTNGLIAAEKFSQYESNLASGNISTNLNISKGDYCWCDINKIFPDYINVALKEGINYFGQKIQGFNDPDTIIMAPESRTSSPVRIVRDELLESSVKGIYPSGEGSGYAGGITTSAMDGMKVFEEIYKKYDIIR